MKGEIKKIIESKKGFITILIKTAEKEYSLVYTGPQYRNYINWQDFKIGDHVTGLRWKNQKAKLIDADSPVELA